MASIATMFSASQLSEQQKQALAGWAAEGASIADLQRRLKEEFDLGVTYMEARLMVLDLGIQIQQAPEQEKPKAPEPAGEDDDEDDDAPAAAAGRVHVSVDQLALPGALVSGKVRFSDGQSAVWMVDQFGRPALDPDTAGYRPPPEDIAEFQRQLSTVLRRQGF